LPSRICIRFYDIFVQVHIIWYIHIYIYIYILLSRVYRVVRCGFDVRGGGVRGLSVYNI